MRPFGVAGWSLAGRWSLVAGKGRAIGQGSGVGRWHGSALVGSGLFSGLTLEC